VSVGDRARCLAATSLILASVHLQELAGIGMARRLAFESPAGAGPAEAAASAPAVASGADAGGRVTVAEAHQMRQAEMQRGEVVRPEVRNTPARTHC
jgi:hypothetical protein